MNSYILKYFRSFFSSYVHLGYCLTGFLITAGSLLPTTAVYASRCDNINVEFINVPDEIDLVGKKLGDTIYRFEHTISGRCHKGDAAESAGQFLYFLTELRSIPAGAWCSNPGNYLTEDDPTGHVRFENTNVDCQGRSYYLGVMAHTEVNITGNIGFNSSNGVLVLTKKTPGRVTINPFFFWKTNFKSMLGGYAGTLESEVGNISGFKDITLVYVPSCSASVNDVDFGDGVLPQTIKSGSLKQVATVKIACDDIVPSYTIKLSSVNGTALPAQDIINSVNPTVGYRLGFQNGHALTLNTELTPAALPTGKDFDIPITVEPIALISDNNELQAGSANSSITIDLTFN